MVKACPQGVQGVHSNYFKLKTKPFRYPFQSNEGDIFSVPNFSNPNEKKP